LVKLVQYLPEGAQRIVRLLGPGAITGLEALLGYRYRHTAVALQEVDVCRIPVPTLVRLEEEHNALAVRLMQHWEHHLRLADSWIRDLSSGTVRVRVIRLLALLAGLAGDGKGRLTLLSQEDMASIIGVSRESLNRSIAQLRSEGLLRRTGPDQEYVLDTTRLSQPGIESDGPAGRHDGGGAGRR
jgi:CRP-like cAMP-binding protein